MALIHERTFEASGKPKRTTLESVGSARFGSIGVRRETSAMGDRKVEGRKEAEVWSDSGGR